jgi:hypothetical protein
MAVEHEIACKRFYQSNVVRLIGKWHASFHIILRRSNLPISLRAAFSSAPGTIGIVYWYSNHVDSVLNAPLKADIRMRHFQHCGIGFVSGITISQSKSATLRNKSRHSKIFNRTIKAAVAQDLFEFAEAGADLVARVRKDKKLKAMWRRFQGNVKRRSLDDLRQSRKVKNKPMKLETAEKEIVKQKNAKITKENVKRAVKKKGKLKRRNKWIKRDVRQKALKKQAAKARPKKRWPGRKFGKRKKTTPSSQKGKRRKKGKMMKQRAKQMKKKKSQTSPKKQAVKMKPTNRKPSRKLGKLKNAKPSKVKPEKNGRKKDERKLKKQLMRKKQKSVTPEILKGKQTDDKNTGVPPQEQKLGMRIPHTKKKETTTKEMSENQEPAKKTIQEVVKQTLKAVEQKKEGKEETLENDGGEIAQPVRKRPALEGIQLLHGVCLNAYTTLQETVPISIKACILCNSLKVTVHILSG